MRIKESLVKYVSPETPRDVRLRAASGGSFTPALEPDDYVTLFYVLSHDRDPAVSGAAKRSLEDYPANLVLTALEKRLAPEVIRALVSMHWENEAILIMTYLNPATDDETLKKMAESGPEEMVDLVAEDRARLRAKPFLLKALEKNSYASKMLLSELKTLLSTAPEPDEAEHRRLIPDKEDAVYKAMKKDLTDEKGRQDADEHNLYQIIKDMSMGHKVKLALTGNKASRELLIKDSNKLIALSVLKNPRVTEDEVMKLTSSKGTPEDLLRHVSKNKEWVKNYNIKLGLVMNAKTPLAVSVKLLESIYEKDLEKLSRSKNIPSVLASAARRKVETKRH